MKKPDDLFERVVFILEQARGNVVRAVNTNMVLAYWLIGREIVQELQGGEKRADYGKKIIQNLSECLTEQYGKGFSAQTLWKFRLFYQAYSDRISILSPKGIESGDEGKISPPGIELVKNASESTESQKGFSPQLTWSHYRALMRVEVVNLSNMVFK